MSTLYGTWSRLFVQVLFIITLVGYGDYTPKTLPGRSIMVVVCILGICFLSLLVVTTMILTNLNSDEEKAYKEIEKIHGSSIKKYYIKEYFDSYLRYKFHSLKSPENRDLRQYYSLRNDYALMQERYLIKIKRLFKNNYKTVQFCSNVIYFWDKGCNSLVNSLYIDLQRLEPIVEAYENDAWFILNDLKYAKIMSFKLFNLMNTMMVIGSSFEIGSMNFLITFS